MSEDATATLEFDIDEMTIGEIEDFETYVGKTLADVDLKSPPAKALVALVWISERRKNPEYTIADARSVPVSALPGDDSAEKDETPTPTDGGAAS